MKIEILHVAGCPNVEPARGLVERTLAEIGVRAEVQAVTVSDSDSSAVHGFAGSPTVLINGRAVEPAAVTGVACRIYANGTGCPSPEAVRRALEQARAEEARCRGQNQE